MGEANTLITEKIFLSYHLFFESVKYLLEEGNMGKLSLGLIALGLLILALGSCTYMGLAVQSTISDPVIMFFIGICLISVGNLGSKKKKK